MILMKGLFKEIWERLWEPVKDVDTPREQGHPGSFVVKFVKYLSV